jgi:hypothetical protein
MTPANLTELRDLGIKLFVAFFCATMGMYLGLNAAIKIVKSLTKDQKPTISQSPPEQKEQKQQPMKEL